MLYLNDVSKVYKIFILLLISVGSFGQELPPIQIFTPQDYGADDQNWSISQADDETIFIANNKGLLEYNGSRWKLYATPNETILRSVEIIDDKVYTGSYMDFGFWEKNQYGLLVYTSLRDSLKVKLIEDEEFWEIIQLEDWVVFQSLDRIYIYNTVNLDLKIIDSDTRITKMYKVDDTIYFQKINDGIYKIENGKEVLVTSAISIKDKEVVNIFPNAINELLIQTKEDGFYNFRSGNISKWDINANDILSEISVYNSLRLRDGNFVLGTISNGIVILTANGELVLRVDKTLGLSNNTVLSLLEDISGNLWLGLDNGVNTLNLQSPFKVYKDNLGVLGTIYTSAKTDKYLYLGTNQGLFYRALNSNGIFEFISGTKGQVWSLLFIDSTLFCGHDKGTFIINNGTAERIAAKKGAWCVKEIEGRPDLLMQGNYKGLNILEKVNDRWTFRNKIEGFDISSRYFEFISANEILVSHEYKGVYRIKLDSNYQQIERVEKETIDKGISSSIVEYDDKLIYVYESGAFTYNNEEKVFEKDSVLSSYFTSDSYVSGKLVEDVANNRLWGFSDDKIIYVEPGKLSDKPKVNSIYLPSEIRRSKSGYENIMNIYDNSYLLGTTDGYLVIDLDKIKKKEYKVVLNTASYRTSLNEFKPLLIDKDVNLKNKENNIRFTYNTADFNKLSMTLYQYRLLGIYDDWSNWSTNSEVLFENLPYGDYEFEVRAKVGGDLSTNSVSFSFNIAKPWHLKPLAIVIYITLFLASVFLVQFLNRRHYKKQRKKLIENKEREMELRSLENDRQIMEFKNQNLHQDIENKNRELGISTMNLIKKNELLNSIKNELVSAKKLEDFKSVVKLINKNLNTTDDWKLFEEAFNNADKDFLKKIKSKHNTLTSNDLRLCAYLRLNLSSKEIAPLLNISPRSVEVKRYRLRKKMNLPHEMSLSNYIIEF